MEIKGTIMSINLKAAKSLRRGHGRIIAAITGVAFLGALAFGGVGSALTASPKAVVTAPAPPTHSACDQYGVNVMHLDYNNGPCPSGYYKTTWSDTNGSLASTWKLDAAKSIVTGGKFVDNATDIGSLTLAAGTYLVTFNAKATPAATGTPQVFPQFFVYNQPKNAAFAGDEFNVGAGALEPAGTNHDSYYSGTGQVTVPPGGETLHLYAFGYDSDQSAGSYLLDSATVSAIRIG
jgi:hypothetical protein